jgi:hypothetical protein
MHGAGGESEHAADTTRVRGARKGGLAYPRRTRTGDTLAVVGGRLRATARILHIGDTRRARS